ncbi:cell division protein ZapA [Lysobacteraceae bacterium NML08-0793]|nr:cell division protein ZapA [Xanthomonadaceae bacterium NML08-0793]
MSNSQSATEAVNVRILDRDYTIGVSAQERSSLLTAAQTLDARMREIRNGNRVAAIEQIAVLAALHLAHELETLRSHDSDFSQRIEKALDSLEYRVNFLEKA